jgi:uncharacterized protein (TIGR03083 family)
VSSFDDTPHDTLAELEFALAEAEGTTPPERLATSLEAAARRRRAEGRPVDAPEPVGPVEVYAAGAAAMDGLLASLSDDDWARTTIRGLSVQGLVGHVIGIERALCEAIVSPAPDAGDGVGLGHVDATADAVAAERDRAPSATLADFRAATAATLEVVRPLAARPDGLAGVVLLHELALPLDGLLVVRAFELWTHEEDVRRATGRSLSPPPPSSIYAMTSLAVWLLPFVVGQGSPDHRVALVLTGQGGGAWQVDLGAGDAGEEDSAGSGGSEGRRQPAARIVADAVDFCRVVANRLDPDDLGYHVDGDRGLARDVLTAATTLALD